MWTLQHLWWVLALNMTKAMGITSSILPILVFLLQKLDHVIDCNRCLCCKLQKTTKKLKQSVPRELEVWTLTLEANTAFLCNDINTSHRITLRPATWPVYYCKYKCLVLVFCLDHTWPGDLSYLPSVVSPFTPIDGSNEFKNLDNVSIDDKGLSMHTAATFSESLE